MDKSHPIVISLGGSLVVPNGGIDTRFLKEFNMFIRQKIARGWRFFIVVGGGATARHYIDSAREIVGQISDWDLDFLGIHSTHLNAHMIRTIFRDVAHPRVIMNYQKKIVNLQEPLVIAAGWKPGCSTDYDAMLLVRDYGANALINMSNIDSVYDKDPKKFPEALPVKKISWREFEKMITGKWSPGFSSPFDPVATKLAIQLDCSVYVIGKNLDNLGKLLEGKDFEGTLIASE
ncbi:MAG: uridylate kinase, uridylate kinase [Candidatus Gottesmanbacteria bacterium GW2011_GWA2_43_14]|uniref:UMP kinase n=1 Tax=Candidatus Gottesmanbacteria bacterium GW2011_GWA2_43_14 TaxID=1618443 RepID=A0A0G1DJA4_9BACT|nr:MAG: uridylate kinase, uridylate kinase [Candidatus Gottesmanbacteria bacterium GW2011_GWA2_43_14]